MVRIIPPMRRLDALSTECPLDHQRNSSRQNTPPCDPDRSIITTSAPAPRSQRDVLNISTPLHSLRMRPASRRILKCCERVDLGITRLPQRLKGRAVLHAALHDVGIDNHAYRIREHGKDCLDGDPFGGGMEEELQAILDSVAESLLVQTTELMNLLCTCRYLMLQSARGFTQIARNRNSEWASSTEKWR